MGVNSIVKKKLSPVLDQVLRCFKESIRIQSFNQTPLKKVSSFKISNTRHRRPCKLDHTVVPVKTCPALTSSVLYSNLLRYLKQFKEIDVSLLLIH